MTSVFLSYDRQDVALAERIARQLEAAGLDVWWDRQLSAGSEYSREIEQALREAAAVIVLWSSNSVESPWVRDEAAKGRDSGRLIPATLDGTEPPLGFGQFHTIDLSRRRVGRKRSMNELVAATKQKIEARIGTDQTPAVTSAAATAAPPLFRPTLVFGIVALVGIFIAAAYLLYGFLSAPQADEARGGKVAIAGFEPVANDPESSRVARLAEGAVERTFATNFIQTLATGSTSSDAVAEADFTLRGTVDRAEDQVTILASVVEPESGRTLWSTEVSRAVNESRELTEELAIYLADVVRCSTYTKSRMPKYDSVEVYSRIFRACEAERSGGRQYDQLPAVAQALIDVAPKSAQAWAYLANGTAFIHPDRRQQTYAAAKRALELDPHNGAVRWGLAIVPDPEVTLAQRERLLLQGLKLDPEFLWHRNHLGHLMRTVGRTEEGAAWYQEFVSSYPLDHQIRTYVAYLHAQQGRMKQAREEFERIAEVRPWYQMAPAYALRAEIVFGDPERARRWMEAVSLPEDDKRCLDMTIDALRANRTLSVEQIERGCEGGIGFVHPAQVLAKFGHHEAVITLLQEMDPPHLATQGPWVFYEPDFAAVRADPRFIPLLARFGIPQYWLETNKWPDFCREQRLPYDCRRAAEVAVKRLAGSNGR